MAMTWSRIVVVGLSLCLIAGLSGCPRTPSPAGPDPTAALPPLKLLVVDDPNLGKAIAREWQARTEETIEVRDIAATDLAAASRLPGDVIVFPSGLIGQLAERKLIVPLEDSLLAEPEFDRRDIFDQIRLREMTWGNRSVAVPLGSPQLLLAYRADVFEKLGIAPPADWAEYQASIEKLADRAALGELAPPADQAWHAAAEPLADGWAGQLLLARAAAYAAHRDQFSPLFELDAAEPLIDRPPYTRALKELSAAAKAGGFAESRWTPPECLAELLAGRCAMAIGWPAPEPGAAEIKPVGNVRFALLPGAMLSYNFATKRWENSESPEPLRAPCLATAGRMAAICSNTSSQKRAEGFLAWMAGKPTSSQIGPHSRGTTLFRQSQTADPERWTGGHSAAQSKEYAETLAQALSLPQVSPGMRLPGRTDYLAALDKAVHSAIAGEATPAELLAETKKQWAEITQAIGVEEQTLANLRSLGQADFP
jgi:ABC-type glycerol-3-phosphate transport system substrate-binding protein